MIIIVNLQDTLNPINAAERVKVNQNWAELRRGFSSLQNQIAFLSGGEDVDAIIQRINNAIAMAEQGAQTAIDEVNNNYAERVLEINQALSDLSEALDNANAVREATESERLLTIQATNDARDAIALLMSMVNDFRSLGEYNSTLSYKRNNLVSLDGRTYIALQDNINQPVTNNAYWALFADRGQNGERGPQGEAGASLNIIGVLSSTENLPATGNPGDAYTINGDLYVWSPESNEWVNVGQIKGEKGDKGERGEDGESGFYQLANFQYVVKPTSNGQTTIEIPLVSFDVNNHALALFRNGVAQQPNVFSVDGRTITLNEAVSDFENTSFYLIITQGVLVQPQATINASFLEDDTLEKSKLSSSLREQIDLSTELQTQIASTTTLGKVRVDGTTIVVNENTGVISSVGSNVPDASTTVKGIVQLNNTVNSTSVTMASTAGVARQLNESKANRTQESSINLTTSLNGWTTNNTRYFKDEFGVVHMYLNISAGTKTSFVAFANLPVDYRPMFDTFSFVHGTNNANTSTHINNVRILTNGNLVLTTVTPVDVDNYVGFLTWRSQ